MRSSSLAFASLSMRPPPVLSNGKDSAVGKTRPMLNATCYKSMVKSTIFSTVTKNAYEKFDNSSLTQRTSKGPQIKLSTTCSKIFIAPIAKQNLLAEVINSRRKSSAKHYESAWRKMYS